MKKILCLLISMIVLLTVGSAFAEAFTLHSGVQFGMTMDEVIQNEKNAGFAKAIKEELHISKSYNCRADHDIISIRISGQIAGVANSSITYHFRNDGRLDSAVYILGNKSDRKVYTNIRKSLINKYGEPDEEMSAVWHAFLDMDVYSETDYRIDNPVFVTSVTPVLYENIKYYYDDSWLIPQNDGGYVIITGCQFTEDIAYTLLNDSGTYLYTYVGYQYFSKEEIENAISKATEIANEYNRQLEDDL